MLADLDALLTTPYVRVDDLLPKRRGAGRPPRITDAELVALAVAQMFLAIPKDRKFLALARCRLGHLFPYLPKQPGYNKRLRAFGSTCCAGRTGCRSPWSSRRPMSPNAWSPPRCAS